jgi:subtilisin family serine protease
MKHVFRFGMLALLAGLLSVPFFAQGQPDGMDVIVVFKDDAPFAAFDRDFRSDNRGDLNPMGWGYLNRSVVGTVQALERFHGFNAEHVYSNIVRGFSGRLTASQIAVLRNNPMVAYIEPDGVMSVTAQTLPWGINRIDADISSTRAGNGSGTVTGVNVYVIDTGVYRTHADLNVVNHVNFAGGQNNDCHGHGTHVAGTIAARDNTGDVVGVAPGARVTGVKVLTCTGSGSTSGVIKGVDWVTANAVKPAIANMSLGGGASVTLDNAVKRSADSGVFYAVAAGNSGVNACNSSPARAGTHNGVMTTAATDSTDREASWSNFGSCVDVWAPGVSILSTRRGGGATTMSGTSMAAPHVGGTGALFLSRPQNAGSSAALAETMLKAATIATTRVSKDGRAIRLIYAGGY